MRLKSNHNWELTNLPPGRQALKCKWRIKKKMNSDGLLDRQKARLVIKGFSQVKGIDYRYASIRSFLQGDLSRDEIFMEQPEGFVQKDPKKV